MLTSLLPGLRDVRAPLVSGVLLLVALALFFGGPLEAAAEPSGRSDTLDRLLRGVGRPGLTVAALLLAYLVGSMVVTVVRSAVERVYDRELERFVAPLLNPRSEWKGTPIGDLLSLTDFPLERADVSLSRTPGPLFPYGLPAVFRLFAAFEGDEAVKQAWHRHSAVLALREPVEGGGRRLVLASAELFAEFDRKRSEAELRHGLLLPLPLAALAAGLNTGLSLVTELVVAAALAALLVSLFVQARRLDREAYNLVLYAIADRIISIPMLDTLDWQRR